MDEKPTAEEIFEKIKYIRDNLDDTGFLLAIAEEASEVTKAALKLVRAGGAVFNPTPVTEEEANDNLKEELQDLIMVLFTAGINVPRLAVDTINSGHKLDRWVERIVEAKRNE